jgi:hypothetical protein
VNDYVIGSDDQLFKMACGIHYDLKLVDGKWVAMKKTYRRASAMVDLLPPFGSPSLVG